MWNEATITNAGMAAYNRWVGGAALTLTSAKGGDTVTADPATATDLVNTKQTLSILGTEPADGGHRVRVQVTSAGLASGYNLRQIGIWGKIGNETPVLLILLQDTDGVPVPAAADNADFVFELGVFLQAVSSGSFSAVIDSKALVSRATLTSAISAHNTSATAHQDIRLQLTSPFNFKGDVADLTALEAISSPAQNDTYYVVAEMCRYSWTGSAWARSSLYESEYEDNLSELKNTLQSFTEPSRNLFNPFDVDTGYYLSSGGNVTPDINSQTTGYISVVSGKEYTNTGLPLGFYIATYTSDKSFIERLPGNYTSTRTFGSSVSYVRLSYYQNNFPSDFMFVEGDTLPETYIPYFAIKKVALPDDIQNAANLLVVSPNIFNISTITHGKYINSGGTLQNETNSEVSDYISVEAGEKYCLSILPNGWSWYIGTYSSDKTFIERLNARNNPIEFGSSVAYVRICVYQHSFPAEYMVVNAESLPNVFYPFGYVANNNMIVAENNKVKVSKLSADSFSIQTGKGVHELKHEIDNTKFLDTWRLTKATVNGNELWHDVDVEGPIKQKDASDFMTGYHGDEQLTLLSMLIDGNEINPSDVDVGSVLECTNFTVCVTSDVYLDGSTTEKAFVRYKRLVFEKNTLRIYNTYKYIGENSIQIAISTGTGLYPVKSTVVTSYVTNTGNVIKSEETTDRSSMLDSVSFFGDGFTMNLRVLFGKMDGYYGVVYYYPDQTRYKVYFYQHYTVGENYLVLNNGNELYSGYEIQFV